VEHSTSTTQNPTNLTGFPTEYAQDEVNYRQALLDRQRTVAKYKSINGYQGQKKLDALKDMSVNPFMLNNGYDALTNALQRWKNLATSEEASKLSPEEKEQAASNYWSSTLVPIYSQMLKAKPVDLEVWKKEAYDRALKWDMDEAYNSHWRSGLYEGFKDYENIMLSGAQALGGIIGSQSTDIRNPNAPRVPVLDSTIKSLKRSIAQDTFWHDINPNETWAQGARSFIAEQAMMLPLYRATGFFNEGLIGGLTGGVKVPLTQLLAKSNLGTTVTKLLTNGAEGAAYGYTMQDQAERKNGWQWGIQQAILGTLFSAGGKSFKLKDVVNPEEVSKISEREIEIQAGKNGLSKNNVDSLEQEVSKSLSGVSAAGGRPAVLNVIKSALTHLKDTENLSEDEVRNLVQKNLSEDKPRWNSTYITASYINSLLKQQGKKFSELKPEEVVELKKSLINLIQKGETKVPELLAAEKDDKVGVKAAQETSRKPIEEALDIADRRGSSIVKIGEDPGLLRTRTKYGKDAVSFSVSHEWIAYAKQQVKSAGLKWTSADIKKWLDGLDSADFVDDLKQFFYPKTLAELEPELKWEYKNEDNGKEWPNFLAFMYNYTDQMPKQFGERLSKELEDTNKFEQWFNPRQDIEKQKQYYAKGMYAHIQELLASERYKKPNALGQIGNVYQTTFETLRDPTEWQYDLHKETIEAEQELLAKMFKGPKNVQAYKQAMNAYNILASARFKAMTKGEQTERIEQQSKIDKLLVESSKGARELMEF
jgi:hypothetical protein